MCWSCVRDQGRIKILYLLYKKERIFNGTRKFFNCIQYYYIFLKEEKESDNYNYNLHLYFQNQNIENF